MDAFMRNDLTIQWNIIPQTDSCIYDETPNCSDDIVSIATWQPLAWIQASESMKNDTEDVKRIFFSIITEKGRKESPAA